MVTTYATNEEVAALIRSDVFDGSTKPTDAQVDFIINRSEDRIDQRTGHTYGRTKTIEREITTEIVYRDKVLISKGLSAGDQIFLNKPMIEKSSEKLIWDKEQNLFLEKLPPLKRDVLKLKIIEIGTIEPRNSIKVRAKMTV